MSDLNRLANKKETQFIHMCDSEVPIDNFLPRVKAKNIVIYIYRLNVIRLMTRQ